MLSTLAQFGETGLWGLELVVAIIFLVHGVAKLRSGGAGMGKMGLVVGVIETVGGLLLAFNMYVQMVAIVFGLIMIGAIYYKTTKWKVPFFSHSSTGWEFDLALLAVCAFLATNV